MFIAPVDATLGEAEWRALRRGPPIRAPGGCPAAPDAPVPVVVPTQFVLDGDTVWLHLVRANPLFGALAENPRVAAQRGRRLGLHPLVLEGDRRRGPGARDPDDLLRRRAAGRDEPSCTTSATAPGSVAAILRRQLTALQPDVEVADPAEAHAAQAARDPGHRDHASSEVTAKFKYGGNVDERHRRAVADRLVRRGGPGDDAAAGHVVRRLGG